MSRQKHRKSTVQGNRKPPDNDCSAADKHHRKTREPCYHPHQQRLRRKPRFLPLSGYTWRPEPSAPTGVVPLQSPVGPIIPISEDTPWIHPTVSVEANQPLPARELSLGAWRGARTVPPCSSVMKTPPHFKCREAERGTWTSIPTRKEWVGVPSPHRPHLLCWSRDFPSGPGVENLPSNARDAGLLPGWGPRIPHALGQPTRGNNWACATTKTWCSQK